MDEMKVQRTKQEDSCAWEQILASGRLVFETFFQSLRLFQHVSILIWLLLLLFFLYYFQSTKHHLLYFADRLVRLLSNIRPNQPFIHQFTEVLVFALQLTRGQLSLLAALLVWFHRGNILNTMLLLLRPCLLMSWKISNLVCSKVAILSIARKTSLNVL